MNIDPRPLLRNVILACCALWPIGGAAADWITAPSYYTHDPMTAERVNQYAAVGPFYYYERGDYLKSGYRHYRSTIEAGGSADNLHIVEEWGRPVRPYDEWRFPYRPYSVPYDLWGPPPFAGLGFPAFGGGYGPYGPGYGPGFPPGGGGPGMGPGPGPGGGGPGPGPGPGGGGPPAFPGPGGPYGGYPVGPGGFVPQQWFDGHWPTYRNRDRSGYYEPYR